MFCNVVSFHKKIVSLSSGVVSTIPMSSAIMPALKSEFRSLTVATRRSISERQGIIRSLSDNSVIAQMLCDNPDKLTRDTALFMARKKAELMRSIMYINKEAVTGNMKLEQELSTTERELAESDAKTKLELTRINSEQEARRRKAEIEQDLALQRFKRELGTEVSKARTTSEQAVSGLAGNLAKGRRKATVDDNARRVGFRRRMLRKDADAIAASKVKAAAEAEAKQQQNKRTFAEFSLLRKQFKENLEQLHREEEARLGKPGEVRIQRRIRRPQLKMDSRGYYYIIKAYLHKID